MESTRQTVSDYQIVDHGMEHEQYFQGCGTAFTEYTDCFTGIGNNARESLDDALEQACMSGWECDEPFCNDEPLGDGHVCIFGDFERSRMAGTVHRKCTIAGCKEITLYSEDEDSTDCHYYVSIRLR